MHGRSCSRIILAMLCPLLCLGLFGCFGRKAKVIGVVTPEQNPSYVPGQLIGMFDSEVEAKETAILYEIELESFRGGMAVFKVNKNLQETIALGEKNGWPQLYLNHIYTIDD